MYSLYDFKHMVVEKVFNMMNGYLKTQLAHPKERIELEVIDTAKIEYGKKDYISKVKTASFDNKDIEWISYAVYSYFVEGSE